VAEAALRTYAEKRDLAMDVYRKRGETALRAVAAGVAVIPKTYEQVIAVVADAGYDGATMPEIVDTLGLSTSGPVSGALSNAHMAGLLVRLAETR
jgi:hypothetical protein